MLRRAALLFIAILFAVPLQASIANVYVGQASAGGDTGADCANQHGMAAYVNSAGNWGSGASQIGTTTNDTVVHLCGTITTPPSMLGSGSSGHVITFLWEEGARISVPFDRIMNLAGQSYFLFNGGIACGPATACYTLETTHLTTYVSGQAGIIEATDNGSGLGHQYSDTQAFFNCLGCSNIEIKNLIIRNMYIHSSLADTTANTDTGPFIFQCSGGSGGCGAGTISIHDNAIHDCGNCISIQATSSTTVNIYSNEFWRMNWAEEYSGSGSRTHNFHDNHCHDTSNWDTTLDQWHHNCIHSYMDTGATDSLAFNIYNNTSDGSWGSCCTTALMWYNETTLMAATKFYNNLIIQACDGSTAPGIVASGDSAIWVNNTFSGCQAQTGNVAAITILGTNMRFQNNAVEKFGQYAYFAAGSTFTAIDYNQWGQIGNSGNNNWQCGATGTDVFATWQSLCGDGAHSSRQSDLGLTVGVPTVASSVYHAGVDLSSLSITALNTSLNGVARSGSWTIGANDVPGGVTEPTVANRIRARR